LRHWCVTVQLLYNIHHIKKHNTSRHLRVTFILLFNSLPPCSLQRCKIKWVGNNSSFFFNLNVFFRNLILYHIIILISTLYLMGIQKLVHFYYFYWFIIGNIECVWYFLYMLCLINLFIVSMLRFERNIFINCIITAVACLNDKMYSATKVFVSQQGNNYCIMWYC